MKGEPDMSTTSIPSIAPIALQPGEGDARWFLGALGTIKSAAETTDGRVAVLEFLWPQGGGSPLHVHRNEDEWFYVIEGELTIWVGGDVVVAPAGSFVYGPRDIAHTFLVTSTVARFLMVTEPAPFADFIRAMSEPAQTLTLPPSSVQPPSPERMTAVAAEYGIEILGPPGIPS
jgi:quercetin dioxygenase-like cupin family protein